MILVTGGTGLIGSHLLYELTKKNNKVRALKRASSNLANVLEVFGYYSPNTQVLFDKIEWVEGDLLDYPSLTQAMEGVSHVYHAAAIVSLDPKDAASMEENNVRGTRHVVEACLERKVTKLCHVSSIAVFDSDRYQGAVDEDCPFIEGRHHLAYALSKKASEQYIWEGVRKGLKCVIVNPAVVLGPGFSGQSSAKLVSAAVKGMWFYTTGGNSFVDVTDVARAMMLLMERPIEGQRFILSGSSVSFQELFHQFALEMKHRKPWVRISPGAGRLFWQLIRLRNKLLPGTSPITYDVLESAFRISRYSGEKMVESTGFQYTPLSETIRHICTIYRQQ